MSSYRFGADLAFAATLPGQRAGTGGTATIGVLAPMSGLLAPWGLPGYHAALLWAEEVNARGGLRLGAARAQVRICGYDDRYDPGRALIGARKLAREERATLLLMLGGDTVPAIAEFLAGEKLLATTLLPGDLSPDLPYLIAPCEAHPIFLTGGVEWLAENRPDLRRAALCARKDALGAPSAATYRAALEAAGIALVREIQFSGDPGDFDALYAALTEDDPDILCFGTLFERYVHGLTEAAYRAGFRGQILSCTCDNYPTLIARTSVDFMEGFLFHFPDFDDPALEAQQIRFNDPGGFYARFLARHSREWGAVAWEYYAILEIWRGAVERAQTIDPRAALSTLKTEGFSFNPFGPARWWGRDLFGVDNALVGLWPVVRVEGGKARIKQFRSIPDWWDRHGPILLRHMRAGGLMWDQRPRLRGAGQPVSPHGDPQPAHPARTSSW